MKFVPVWKINLITVVCALLIAPPAAANAAARSFADMSIEELMNESVTSVSKKKQRLADVASAVTVLSTEDLRRSGASSIADALRLVPGLDVASFNAREWAISSRGTNNLYANKLLVLVDGRSVYTPLFAGVYWDLQQTILDDVERIEVIRGPGATVWGANAVNGVINVATLSARETQGGLLSVSRGTAQDSSFGLRFGGAASEQTYYRVYASRVEDEHRLTNGRLAGDRWTGTHGGVRVDTYPRSGEHFTWQAEGTDSKLRDGTVDTTNLNTVGRWTRQWSPTSNLQAQLYFDRDHHDEPARMRTTISTADFSLHHTLLVGERHEVTWGIGYRCSLGLIEQTNPFALVHAPKFRLEVASAFAQDEIKLVPDRLSLTLGTKVERNDFTGVEWQPGARLVFKPSADQSLWTAVSRAVRTPDVIEGSKAVGVMYGGPFAAPGGLYVPALVGNTEVRSDVLIAFEAGYRAQVSRNLSVDLTGFYNQYRHLIDYGTVTRLLPGSPVGVAEMPWRNGEGGYTRGAELAVNFSPAFNWRLHASYTRFQQRIHSATRPAALDFTSPGHQAALRASWDAAKHVNIDAQLRYVGSSTGVPAYVSADLRLAWQINEKFEAALIGKDLLDPQHPEQAPTVFATMTELPRTISLRLTWRY